MSLQSDPDMGINSWLEDELYQQYLHDRTAVDDEWKHLFEGNGGPKPATAPTKPLSAASSPRRSSISLNRTRACAFLPAAAISSSTSRAPSPRRRRSRRG